MQQRFQLLYQDETKNDFKVLENEWTASEGWAYFIFCWQKKWV